MDELLDNRPRLSSSLSDSFSYLLVFFLLLSRLNLLVFPFLPVKATCAYLVPHTSSPIPRPPTPLAHSSLHISPSTPLPSVWSYPSFPTPSPLRPGPPLHLSILAHRLAKFNLPRSTSSLLTPHPHLATASLTRPLSEENETDDRSDGSEKSRSSSHHPAL